MPVLITSACIILLMPPTAALPQGGATTALQARSVESSKFDIDLNDPDSRLIDRSSVAEQDINQINELMAALGDLRKAEDSLSDLSLRYMKLNQTDMRALHFLIVSQSAKSLVTAGKLATHLEISSASTTKLLDRLERAGHITRSPHPTDRRALTIAITAPTHEAAMQTVGRQQSKRFIAAARLTGQQRQTVIDFIRDMTTQITPTTEAWAQVGA